MGTPIGKPGGAMTKGVVLHQRAEGLPEVSWQREQFLYAGLRSDHAQPDRLSLGGAVYSLPSCMGKARGTQARIFFVRFRWSTVLGRPVAAYCSVAFRGLKRLCSRRRRIRMLLSAGKAIARWDHDDIFGADQHHRLPSDQDFRRW